MTDALALHGIRKRFGGTVALDGVDLRVRRGTVHALLGENGAGKSTLMHIVAGLLRADAGTIEVEGRAHVASDPRDARRLGIGMVHQHFTSVAALTVWENIALAAQWPIAGARDQAVALFTERGVTLDADARAGDLSVGLRQQLELQKALAARPRILLLDEPTGVLTPPEVHELFRATKEFIERGGSVVLITHKLDEALGQADAITVLRRGVVTLRWGPESGVDRPTRAELVAAMLGSDEITGHEPRVSGNGGEVVASVQGLELRAGEIVGIAGVEGNGQRELLRSIETTAFIPEDRTTEGLILDFTLTENLALRASGQGSPASGPLIDWRVTHARMAELIGAYSIKTTGPDAPASSLSGGNQQKVVVARALEGAPRLIVAENPARGLDVGAAREVFERLRAAAASGAAVIFHSTDLDEVVTWADRVVVMAGGRVILPPAGADRTEIGALMVSGQGRA
ncbi:MAG: ATP-binding cassette domain-containing protein [Gemmatimonadota bacterium]